MPDRRFLSWAETHPGARRPRNEDSYLVRDEIGLWVVADGAGGHTRGDLASGMIAERLRQIDGQLPAARVLSDVRNALQETHAALQEKMAELGEGTLIASTVVALLAAGDHFAVLWAGDSRVYLLRDGQLSQITRDHSLVQSLVESGAISPEQAEHHPQANVITRAVGADAPALELDKVTGQMEAGDRFLLCSDGLTKALPEQEILELLRASGGASPAELLVYAALAREATDNVTAVVVEVAG